MKKTLGFIVSVILASLIMLGFYTWFKPKELNLTKPSEQVIIGKAMVLDGDSLIIDNQSIRLIGIDAFEYNQNCGAFRCGQKAKSELSKLTENQRITCKGNDIDQYGRLLMRCYNQTQKDLGAVMVRAGLAVAYRKYSLEYVAYEDEAKKNRSGAWGFWFDSPQSFRQVNSRNYENTYG